MQQYKGIPHNINSALIGRVVRNNRWSLRNTKNILVGDYDETKQGYLATISSSSFEKELNAQGVSLVKEVEEFNDNDIIKINEEGRINKLWNTDSIHNALFLTERCNSNCIMCPQPPVQSEIDLTDDNLRIIELLKHTPSSVVLTGGEPTLKGEKLFKILDTLRRKFPRTRVYILSNATLFSKIEFTRDFANHCNENVIVEVPIYSDYPDLHNKIVGTNSFYKTLRGIHNLAKFEIKVGIRNVINKMNFDRLEPYSEFIYRNFPFIFQIALMQMELEGNAKTNFSDVYIDPCDYIENVKSAVFSLYNRGLNVLIYNFQLCLLPESIRKFAPRSITEWKNLFLPVCEKCDLKSECPGFFKSVINHPSRDIKPIIF